MNRPGAGLGMGPRPRIATWVHHHRQAASDSLNKILLKPVSSLLTWLVVGIALALPTTLLLLLNNVSAVTAQQESPARFSLLLNNAIEEARAVELADGLAARIDIERVQFLHRDNALATFADDTGLGTLLDSLEENPLPHTLLISPAKELTTERLSGLADALRELPDVADVVFDTLWRSRLETALEMGRRVVFGLGALMLVGAVLILANTIRLAIEARREEIVVIKLIGGGDAFARRPFLYTGLWFGIGGGILATVLVSVFFLFLSAPADALLGLYGQSHVLQGLGVIDALNLTLVGGVLGQLSAWQATGLHLKAVEPR